MFENFKHSPVNGRSVFVPKGASSFSVHRTVYVLQDEVQTFFKSEKNTWVLALILFAYSITPVVCLGQIIEFQINTQND